MTNEGAIFLWYTQNLNLGLKNITGLKQSGACPDSTWLRSLRLQILSIISKSLSKLDIYFNHKSETGFGTVFCLFILLSN